MATPEHTWVSNAKGRALPSAGTASGSTDPAHAAASSPAAQPSIVRTEGRWLRNSRSTTM